MVEGLEAEGMGEAGTACVGSGMHSRSGAIAKAFGEAAPAALIAVGGNGEWVEHNQRFAALLGLSDPRASWATLRGLLLWIDRQGSETARAVGALLSRPGASSSGTLHARDGRSIEWTRARIEDPDPSLSGYAWAFQDVSESQQLGRALLDAESWLRMLEAHEAGVLLELDAQRRIVGLWGRGDAFFEQTDTELEGKRLSEALNAASGAELDALIHCVLDSGCPAEQECIVEPSGRPRRVLLASALLLSESGERRATLMLRDVTERARVQAQLVRSERLASVGFLAAGIAHEVNNPLSYILLNLHRLRSSLSNRPLEGELLSALEMSIEGAERVQAIVRDLNAFSRADSGRSLPVDLRPALEFAIRMAMPEIRRRARLNRHLGELPLVAASETRLSQLFLNLIINAAHSIPEGAPSRNEIVVVTRADERGNAVVEVRDTGAGISPSVMQHIFDPFYTSKPEGMGTGLGLTICHSIVTSLNGNIEVESKEGRGSVFRVTLPAAPSSSS